MSAGWLVLRGATGNNLRSLDAAIPVGPDKPGFRLRLNLFTGACPGSIGMTGVSGSRKSTSSNFPVVNRKSSIANRITLYPRLLYVEDSDHRRALRAQDDVGAQYWPCMRLSELSPTPSTRRLSD